VLASAVWRMAARKQQAPGRAACRRRRADGWPGIALRRSPRATSRDCWGTGGGQNRPPMARRLSLRYPGGLTWAARAMRRGVVKRASCRSKNRGTGTLGLVASPSRSPSPTGRYEPERAG
jgi:hypothetical protein